MTSTRASAIVPRSARAPSRTACQPHAIGSASAAFASGTPSGTVTRLPRGIAT